MCTTKPQSRRTVLAGGLATVAVSALGGCAEREFEDSAAASVKSKTLQRVDQVVAAQERHWVGDGFRVSTIFAPHVVDAQTLSPFILMDHAAPRHFEPAAKPRGVGEHPHRGFETVTFAYQGEVAHRDSHGGGGTIGEGGVQWMTAASGVVHEEFHSQTFTKTGGMFEMVQLWVNLPAAKKMSEPRYQKLEGKTFPVVDLGGASARLIAGSLGGKTGPAKTHTPMTVFDLAFKQEGTAKFELEAGTTTLLLLLEGAGRVQDDRKLSAGQLVIFDRASTGAIRLQAKLGARALVLNGQPLNEPVVAHGPFVMNTREEIQTAIADFRRGKMGRLPPKVGTGA